jgi:hypothetical protein
VVHKRQKNWRRSLGHGSRIGRTKLEISLVFVSVVFDVDTVYDGEILSMSETRYRNIATEGRRVQARRERLHTGLLTDHARGDWHGSSDARCRTRGRDYWIRTDGPVR